MSQTPTTDVTEADLKVADSPPMAPHALADAPPPSGQPVPRVTVPVDEKAKAWLMQSATIKLLSRGGLLILVLLVLADFAIHSHPYFGIDGTFGFWAWYGLIAALVMAIVAKGFGMILKRKDGYYDDE